MRRQKKKRENQSLWAACSWRRYSRSPKCTTPKCWRQPTTRCHPSLGRVDGYATSPRSCTPTEAMIEPFTASAPTALRRRNDQTSRRRSPLGDACAPRRRKQRGQRTGGWSGECGRTCCLFEGMDGASSSFFTRALRSRELAHLRSRHGVSRGLRRARDSVSASYRRHNAFPNHFVRS